MGGIKKWWKMGTGTDGNGTPVSGTLQELIWGNSGKRQREEAGVERVSFFTTV
jgi:hypothetical protein